MTPKKFHLKSSIQTTLILGTLLSSLGLFLSACGQNAHTTAPTPYPGLNVGYNGDDLNNGNYEINFSLQNDAGDPNYQPERVTLTFESLDGNTIYFSGEFRAGMNVLNEDPLAVDPRSIQTWSQIKPAIKQGEIKNGSKFVFDKRLWALDSGNLTHYYRLFTGQTGTLIPADQRPAPKGLRMKAFVVNQYGLSNQTSITMPVRWRYAFDDEALGRGVDQPDGSRLFSPEMSTNRVVAGLEWVSTPALLNSNSACQAAWGLNYPFNYVAMTKNVRDFKARVTGLRLPDGSWKDVDIARDSVLEAMGTALGGSLALWEPITAYEGLCNKKVWGIVLIDRFIDLDVNGIRFTVDLNGQTMDVVYGLTKMEGF